MSTSQLKLPKHILNKAKYRYDEIGWSRSDVVEAINAASHVLLATLGGQVQYILPNATAELYWIDYETAPKKEEENWHQYCIRTANECIKKIKAWKPDDIKKDALIFEKLKEMDEGGQDINQYLVFIVYFKEEI